jgi:hypothetical protein
MATIKKTTTPPLVAAKMVKSTSAPTPQASNASAPKSLPPGVKVETGEKEDLGTHWTKKSGNSVQGMSNQLQKYGLRSEGGSSEFMNYEKRDTKELGRVGEALDKMATTKKGDINVATSTGADASGRMQVMEGLKDMYKAADKAGYTTSDQFRTAYDNLLNTTSERNRKLLKDPMLQRQLSNLKEVAGQHFADLVKSRDEEQAKKPPKGTVTDESGSASTNASYKDLPAYNKAQVPAGIKLTVKKK